VEFGVDLRQMADYFGQSYYGYAVGVDDGVASGFSHALAAKSKAVNDLPAARSFCAQGIQQRGSVHFSRSFAGGDQNFDFASVFGSGGHGREKDNRPAPNPHKH